MNYENGQLFGAKAWLSAPVMPCVAHDHEPFASLVHFIVAPAICVGAFKTVHKIPELSVNIVQFPVVVCNPIVALLIVVSPEFAATS